MWTAIGAIVCFEAEGLVPPPLAQSMALGTGGAAYAEAAFDLRHEGNVSLVTPTLQ